MKITRLGPARPLLQSGYGSQQFLPPDGAAGQVVTATGSNGAYWGENVARITANGSNAVVGPFVNFAAGSNVILAVSSNTINIASTGGGGAISAGSNSTHVQEISMAGASSSLWSPFDHAHAGVAQITSSSSNTLQRGTVNLRAGSGIAFGATDTDGDGEFDTLTISNTGSAAGSGTDRNGYALLAIQTASSSSSLDFTTRNATGQSGAIFQSDFDVYQIVIYGFDVATDGAVPYLRFSTNGGSSYDTSSIYSWVNSHQQFGTNTITGSNAASVGQIAIFADSAGVGLEINGDPGLQCTINLYNPLSATWNKWVDAIGHAMYNSGGGINFSMTMAGVYASHTAVDAFRIIMSTGNIAAGVVAVYGKAKT